MKTPLSFFFILITLSLIPISYATTASAGISAQVEGLTDDDYVLEPDEELDLSEDLETVPEVKKTVGGVAVTLSKKVTINSADAKPIKLTNTALKKVTVQIPNGAGVSGPTVWGGTIKPPTLVVTGGTVPTGFQTPTSSIEVGDPDVVLFFDTPVTLNLEDTIGQIAYKLSGSNDWNLISICSGIFANPVAPIEPNECSINDGVDTKVLTWHFTEFAGLSSTPLISATPSAPSSSISSSNSGGGGGRSSSPSSTSAGFAGKILPEGTVSEASVFPKWFQTSLVTYWSENLISDNEFKNAMNYMLNKNIIRIDIAEEREGQLLNLAPSIKQLFKLWSSDKLSDSAIINIIKYYRTVGVW